MTFALLAADPAARMGALALALAAEFRAVDEAAALAQLDELGAEVRAAAAETGDELGALAMVLGGEYGFAGAREEYDHPDHSMLDLVLEHRRGLPIALSVVYVETARRAGIALDGVGLSGHYVVGQFRRGAAPVLLDPFAGGGRTPRAGPVGGAPLGRARDRAADAQQPRRVLHAPQRPRPRDPRGRVAARAPARARPA